MTNRSLDELIPVVKAIAEKFILNCAAAGIKVIITSTYRSAEEQDALYAQGRTSPGKRVTNARAYQSYHQFRCAFDFVPIVNGKAQWNDPGTFTRCGEIAESVGLEWAGRWTGKFREMAHVQFTGGLTLADLQSGKEVA